MEVVANMDHQSTLTSRIPSSNEDDSDSPASLFDLIKSHSSQSEKNDDSDPPQSLSNLMKSHDDSDQHLSLFDLINSHKTQTSSNESNFANTVSARNVDNNATSLSELTVKHLRLNDASQTEEFQTLEEYTKSYLTSEGNNLLRSSCAPKCGKSNFEKHVEAVNDKLSNCKLNNAVTGARAEPRKIDLTIALQNKCKSNSSPIISQADDSGTVKFAIFARPLRECNENVTHLAEACLPYAGTTFSSFGRIIIKKWERKILRKKYHYIEKRKPYNVSKCFKFDTLSPDDFVMKNRARNNSTNDS